MRTSRRASAGKQATRRAEPSSNRVDLDSGECVNRRQLNAMARADLRAGSGLERACELDHDLTRGGP